MGDFVDTPCASSGSGVETDPSSIDMARHRTSGDPISSSYYSDAWIEGTGYVLPSRDPFQEDRSPIRLKTCTRAHVIPPPFAGAPYTLSWSFYNSDEDVCFGFVPGDDLGWPRKSPFRLLFSQRFQRIEAGGLVCRQSSCRRHTPSSREASSVPSTLARILLKAISRPVEVSSAKGAKPQSSVVPNC